MKKLIYLIVLALILGLVLTGCSSLSNIGQIPATEQMKVKPTGNLAGAVKVDWNLSGAVMPVPPYGDYGTVDIPGSDTASKLIVNQPNGNTEVAVTGVMNGLTPNTDYTVYLSNGYIPYVFTGWNVGGTYVINVVYLNVDYPETLVLTQSGTSITGVTLDTIPSAPASHFTISNGSVNGNDIDIYATNGSLVVHMTGTIAADGSMSGSWADEAPGTRTGTWATSGVATATGTGTTGWTGLFTDTVQPFTFTTDAYGSGSWHVNLTDANLTGSSPYHLSVWINVGATILISDNFTVVK